MDPRIHRATRRAEVDESGTPPRSAVTVRAWARLPGKTVSAYGADFTAAAAADVAAGFPTPADYNAAVAAARKAPVS